MANVALFLASEEASYITGAVVPVDGGWSTVYPHSPRSPRSTSELPPISGHELTNSTGRHCTLVVRESHGLFSRHLAWPSSDSIGQ